MEPNRLRTDGMLATLALEWVGVMEAASAIEGLLDGALAYCAQKMHLHSTETALALLCEGNPMARWYAHHSLAGQVAAILGNLDDTVQSVYVFDLDATPEDLAFGEAFPASPIHMIARTRRKTEALYTLVRALEGALLEEYARRVGPGQLEHLLDVQVIDDEDVEKRRGYAGLLRSLHNRPIRVWQREE